MSTDPTAGLPASPPKAKDRNAAQEQVNRLLSALAPERAAHRMGLKVASIERHRTPRGCILQTPTGAVTVSWFADSDQGGELGELQIGTWRGIVSRPGSSQQVGGAEFVEGMVLRPVETEPGSLGWRASDGTHYSTDALIAQCTKMLEEWTGPDVIEPEP
jgi:hypothetical protein